MYNNNDDNYNNCNYNDHGYNDGDDSNGDDDDNDSYACYMLYYLDSFTIKINGGTELITIAFNYFLDNWYNNLDAIKLYKANDIIDTSGKNAVFIL